MIETVKKLFGDLWSWNPLVTAISGALLALLVVTLLVVGVTRLVRGTRGAPPNVKLKAGTFVVQAGVTWAVVTGTYAFCERYFRLPWWESVAFAVFLEAATWVTVGMIIAHGRGKDDKDEPNTGFGAAGPFFFLFSVLGGVLAIIAGETAGAMVGRAVIVVFGTCLWYLTLLTYTRRSGTRTRFRWTPRRLFVAIGALEPEDQDVDNEHQEWQIRRLARAMRWANGRPPWRWIGQRALISRAEQTAEDIIEAARRRYAVAHLLVTTVRPDSDVMTRVIESVKADMGVGSPNRATGEDVPTSPAPVTIEPRALPEVEPSSERRALPEAMPVTEPHPVSEVASGTGQQSSGTGHRALPEVASGTTPRALPEVSPAIERRAPRRVPTPRQAAGSEPGTNGRALPADIGQMTDAEQRQSAREIYAASLAAGAPLSGAELARMYGRSDPKWGTRRIGEVRWAQEQAIDPGSLVDAAPQVPAPMVGVASQEDENR
ncbi:hypothetical protein ABZS77_29665 [Micromonospora sp. NPDC005298]|uniref:hypothetical protein n=1 Tax=Micromonospora sp. NPDC005298 TaxID=3156873 RepID=UPI0033A5EA8D